MDFWLGSLVSINAFRHFSPITPRRHHCRANLSSELVERTFSIMRPLPRSTRKIIDYNNDDDHDDEWLSPYEGGNARKRPRVSFAAADNDDDSSHAPVSRL